MSYRRVLFSYIDNIWEFIKYFMRIVSPARFSIIILIAVTLFLIFVDQGQDILRAMTETKENPYKQIIWFFLALLLWALNSWYWARIMLRFNFDKQGTCYSEEETLRRIIPRILGFLPFVIVAIAFYKTESSITKVLPFILFTLCIGLLFYIFLLKRIPLMERFSKSSFIKKSRLHTVIKIENSRELYRASYRRLGDVPRAVWLMLILLFIIDILLLIDFLRSVEVPPHFGTGAILLFAAASWIALGTSAVYAGTRLTFPVITLLFLYAIVISRCNDNHKVRYLQNTVAQKATLQSDFHKWIDNIDDKHKATPFFIIAAEGGGIRAAYTTAHFLSQLQDKNRSFATHLYAISGVSGGSLGAALFTAVLHEWYNQNDNMEYKNEKTLLCKAGDVSSKSKSDFTSCSKAVLSQDFLSAATAYMLYPDLIQRFLPYPIEQFDRSIALEQSWELAWAKVFPPQNNQKKTAFAKGFLALWQKDKKKEKWRLPNLFLNATWVERGKRVISSNLAVDPKIFSDSVDLLALLKRDIPLSTAVHNSARFTYVSPAGRVYIPSSKKNWGHIVDGGYFENSGASTAYNILQATLPYVKRRKNLIPIVIVITNDPSIKAPCERTQEGCKATQYSNEILSPIRALLATRAARAGYARHELKNYIHSQGGLYLEVGLCPEQGPLPLGWTLSDAAKDNMDKQLDSYIKKTAKSIRGKFDPLNTEHLKVLQKELKSRCQTKNEKR